MITTLTRLKPTFGSTCNEVYIFYGKKPTNDTNYIKLHIAMLILR